MLPTERIATALSRVTTTMIGRTFKPSLATVPPELWRTAMLSIPGTKPVTVAISSDRQGCAALAAAMLMMDEEELELAMIDDFMRELVNMAAGQIRNDLSLDQALGLPRVIDGEPFFKNSKNWTHHILSSETISMVVSLVPTIATG